MNAAPAHSGRETGPSDRPPRLALPVDSSECPLIPVVRAGAGVALLPVVETLVERGFRLIELTLTTSDVYRQLALIRERIGSAASIGMGTVTSADLAVTAMSEGAEFLVTPTALPEVVEIGRRRGVAVVAGALTPTEAAAVWDAGAAAVKLFPAAAVGPDYLGLVAGPFPDMRLLPSGGIGIADIPAWLRAGAVYVGLGGSLIGDGFTDDTRSGLARRADEAWRLVAEVRGA